MYCELELTAPFVVGRTAATSIQTKRVGNGPIVPKDISDVSDEEGSGEDYRDAERSEVFDSPQASSFLVRD